MSLLFENAIEAFSLEHGSLYAPDESELEAGRDSPLPSRTIVAQARERAVLAHPDDGDRTCIPVHEADSAALTGEYLCYCDHDLFGEVFIYDDGSETDYVDRETFERTALADRIRFWHSDYVPEETPEYYASPIDSPERPTAPIDRDQFFDELAAYVDRERDTRREETRDRFERDGTSPQSLYDDGEDAIPSLRGTGGPSDGSYRFVLSDDLIEAVDERREGERWSIEREFGVYAGNDVLLYPPSRDHAPDSFPLLATVDAVSGRTVRLEIDWRSVAERSAVGRFLGRERVGYGLAVVLNPVPYERERDAIEAVREAAIGDVLTGERPLTFGASLAANSDWHDADLNQEQRVAVRHALLADDLFCIHGPPGTGKTRTLVEIVRRAAQAGASVLVCADSNQAVDNLVVGSSTTEAFDERSLHAYGQHGAEEFVLERHNGRRSARALVRDSYGSVGGADVVASTNGSAATLSARFDLVVMDEATQATCPTSCIPLSKGSRIVLAGDHKQLPPYSSTDEPPESAHGRSLFEHLYADGGVYEGVGVQLTTQYRMHRDVAYFPNRRFYDRTLRNGRDIAALEGREAICGFDIGGRERVDGGTSRSNPTEARLVAHLVEQLVDDDVSPGEIGVITPYGAQVAEVARALDRRLDSGDARAVTVDTIDSFQGSEKTAIVVSMVRSNGDGRVGFLDRPEDGPRRLNVALTRAKRYCAVVANWHTLTTPAGGDDDGNADPRETRDSCTDLYRDLESHLTDTGRMRRVEPEFLPA